MDNSSIQGTLVPDGAGGFFVATGEAGKGPATLPRGASLTPLCDQLSFHDALSYIKERTCRDRNEVDFPPIPNRLEICPLWGTARVRRVVKKDKSGRQLPGKDKSVKGYIWVDIDPIAILANKYIVRSCHTLDNTEHEYRTGNINHLYNPFMACLFAGRSHPEEDVIVAESPCTGDSLEYPVLRNGKNEFVKAKIRAHQAVANIFFMRDKDQRPFLFLGRRYDSANEVPWAHSMFRYMKAWSERLGVGLAVGDTWGGYPIVPPQYKAGMWCDGEYGLQSCEKLVVLQTPTFKLPEVFCYYGDDSSEYKGNRGVDYTFGTSDAIIVIQPKLSGELSTHMAPLRDMKNRSATSPLEPDSAGIECYNCGCRLDEGEVYRGADDEDYCYKCYTSWFSECDNCGTSVYRDEALTATDGSYCDRCFDRLFAECDKCGEHFDKDALTVINFDDEIFTDRVCSDCADDLDSRECSACHNVVYFFNGLPEEEEDFVCRDCKRKRESNAGMPVFVMLGVRA